LLLHQAKDDLVIVNSVRINMGDRLSVLGACLIMSLASFPRDISAQPRSTPPSRLPDAGRQAAAMRRHMDNDDVIALSKARTSDELIVSAIRGAQERRFDTGPRAVAKLKRAGVSERVIGELRRVVAEQAARSVLARARAALLINQTASQVWPRRGAENGPSADQPFRQLRAEVIKWNRFRVGQPTDRTDVTLTFGPAYSATIRRRDTGAVLWTGSADTWGILMSRMRKEIPAHAPSVCVAVWCR
jgi:hypothetical protein